MELYVNSTELYTVTGRCNVHTKTKETPRVKDGKRHPVTVIKLDRKEVK